jgi:SAM-dependent methyltransferase
VEGGEYDVVLFSVSLHHFLDVENAVLKAKSLLRPGGHLLCYEPCHERFLERDAAFVVLIRGLLSCTGNWYNPGELVQPMDDDAVMARNIREVRDEYFFERDKHEEGQSPNDLEASGDEILVSLRRHFTELETRSGFSLIYRVLGGLRGDDETVRRLASFIASFDRTAVKQRYMNENHFYYIGRKD